MDISEHKYKNYGEAIDAIIAYIEERTSRTLAQIATEVNLDQHANLIKRIRRLAHAAYDQLELQECFTYDEMAEFIGSDKPLVNFADQKYDIVFKFRKPTIEIHPDHHAFVIYMDLDYNHVK